MQAASSAPLTEPRCRLQMHVPNDEGYNDAFDSGARHRRLMLIAPINTRVARPHSLAGVLARWRYQAIGGLLVSTLVPYVVRLMVANDEIGMRQLHLTLLWCACAVILGNWLFRNVSIYPGVEASAFLLPSFTVSFTAIAIVLTVGRFEYARTQLIAGYVLSVAWFYFVHSTLHRHQWLRIGYLPFGAFDKLPQVPHINWVELPADGCPSNHDPIIGRLDAIAADLRIDLPDQWERTLSDFALAGTPVYHVKHLAESLTGRVELEHLSENSFGSLIPNTSFLMLKRLIDWIVAVIMGLMLLPLLLAIALAIRLTSNGPALFKQQRIGFRGEPFMVYKFRTMRVAERGAMSERETAMTRSGDARITSLGKILRRTRIDELPQILNILKGQMSWIGPRPEAAVLSRWYEEQIPFYRYRHIVRPGITGWAQVLQGHVADVADVQSKLHYDFYYIKNFSLWMDILIIAKTVKTMMTGYGAR